MAISFRQLQPFGAEVIGVPPDLQMDEQDFRQV